ncbi:MAG: hypothetical protein EAZ55_00865 [Cytophagales bacterium]|nr:MAG: hypothetical protein EAZ55_00865 [Cytophagales bacterium]
MLNRILPFLIILLVYIIGAFIDVMDIDAAQYASISREMVENGQFLQVLHRGQDYLDKPPLLFWVSSFVFYLLGAGSITYRLAPILSSLLTIYATYRIARLYYSERIAYFSALVIASCQAFFLMNHDVRTDTMLTTWATVAVWQIAAFQKYGKHRYWIGAAVAVGLAMLAKGPIGLIVPVLAFGTDFLLRLDFRAFFRWQWLAGLLIVGLILLPMSWGLYQQFDLQPQKVFDGKQGVSGLRFYYWTQSFGRITGESQWDNDAGVFFQAQNFLWSFLPWVLLFVPALVSETWVVLGKAFRLQKEEESFVWAGFVLPFLALSLSRYQLPHYTFVVFPLAAILTAKWLDFLLKESTARSYVRWALGGQIFVFVVVLFLILALSVWAFPAYDVFFWIVLTIGMGACVYMFFNKRNVQMQLVYSSLVMITVANFALNYHVYPTLLKYQIGSVLGKILYENKEIAKERFYVLVRVTGDDRDIFLHSLDFYSQRINPQLASAEELLKKDKKQTHWVYTDAVGYTEIKQLPAVQVEVLQQFDKYHVAVLTLPFLNPAMRPSQVQKVFLLKVNFSITVRP